MRRHVRLCSVNMVLRRLQVPRSLGRDEDFSQSGEIVPIAWHLLLLRPHTACGTTRADLSPYTSATMRRRQNTSLGSQFTTIRRTLLTHACGAYPSALSLRTGCGRRIPGFHFMLRTGFLQNLDGSQAHRVPVPARWTRTCAACTRRH